MRIQLVQTEDKDVNQLQRNIAKVVEPLFDQTKGSFVGTLTGMTATVETLVKWETGLNPCSVTLSIPAMVTGTSNSASMTMMGLPRQIWPVSASWHVFAIVDNNGGAFSLCQVQPTGTITFYKDLNITPGGGFTASGTKGLYGGSLTYVRGI